MRLPVRLVRADDQREGVGEHGFGDDPDDGAALVDDEHGPSRPFGQDGGRLAQGRLHPDTRGVLSITSLTRMSILIPHLGSALVSDRARATLGRRTADAKVRRPPVTGTLRRSAEAGRSAPAARGDQPCRVALVWRYVGRGERRAAMTQTTDRWKEFRPCPQCSFDFATGEGERGCAWGECPYVPEQLNVF